MLTYKEFKQSINENMISTMVSMYKFIDSDLKIVKVKHIKSKYNTPKSCFYNAQKLTLSDPNSEYVLGFYLFHGIPIEHAWVKTSNGYVDSTLADDENNGHEYHSVIEINQEDLKQYISKLGDGCVTISDVNRYRGYKR